MNNRLFALFGALVIVAVGLPFSSMAGSLPMDLGSCPAKQNGWGECVGRVEISSSGIIVTVHAPAGNVWDGFVGGPPTAHACTPTGYQVAFHSDVNGWGADGTWHPAYLPQMVIPNNYPARGYLEARAICKQGGVYEMPFNGAYWTSVNKTGGPLWTDGDNLLVVGHFREPAVSIHGNAIRIDFGTNVAGNLFGTGIGELAYPMHPGNLASCGFLYWDPDRMYRSEAVRILSDHTVVADIPNFPFGKNGWLVCKGPGGGDLYLAVDRWSFPPKTAYNNNDAVMIFKP